MGVKAIKEKYDIKHIVQRMGENICIGSPYVHNIITISPEGKLIRVWDSGSNNPDLKRYLEELTTDEKSGELKKLFYQEDKFSNLIPVYTFNKGKVIKKYCETFGWPNTYTDGFIIYENNSFHTYKEAFKSLMSDSQLRKWEFKNCWQTCKESFVRIFKQIKYLSESIYEYLYVRTITRIESIFKS